jgi:hypothetical protein
MANEEIARGGGLHGQGVGSQREEPRRTDLAIPGYILAVAAIEAFVNELFLSDFGLLVLKQSPGQGSNKTRSRATESLEQLDLRTKLIEIPRELLGRSLDPSRQPHQDMTLLTKLRNDLVHYKMGTTPPRVVQVLAQRGLAFRVAVEQEAGGPQPWADRVSTLEGLQWAFNTACATAVALLDLIPEEKRGAVDWLRHNFSQIS